MNQTQSPPSGVDRSGSVLVRSITSLVCDLDWWLVLATVFLLFVGLTTLWHQGGTSGPNPTPSPLYIKQVDFLIGGVAAAIVFWRIPYIFWSHHIVLPVLYVINLGLLVAVMVRGHEAMGAQRWLNLGPVTLQPSEIAKLVVIFTLAGWLGRRPIKNFVDCLIAIAIIALPALLVFKQPDLGTSLTFGAVYFGTIFWSGAGLSDVLVLLSPVISLILNAIDEKMWITFIGILGTYLAFTWGRGKWNIWLRLGLVTLVILLNVGAGYARPHLWNVLKPYQQKRLTSFINPYADPRGSGYHILQSLIAIGSGGMSGTGLGKGNQSQGQFIPERHTDFIFAVVGEELGMRVTALVVLAYSIICVRAVLIAYRCREEPCGSVMAIGIMCMFLFHAFLNMGMTMGIMPVAGVPLPFLSYGGTALIIDLSAIGILCSITAMNPKPRKDRWQ